MIVAMNCPVASQTAQAAGFVRPLPAARPPRRHHLAATVTVRATSQPKQRILDLMSSGASLYSTGEAGAQLTAAVAELVAANTCRQPGPDSLTLGQGTWEVFWAPHIARLSAALGARFKIRYILRGEELISNVRYQHPLLGTGWLSASGSLAAADATTLLIHFDRFWLDVGANSLRPELVPPPTAAKTATSAVTETGQQGGDGNTGGVVQGFIDEVVGALGRASFLPSLARFPVEYLEEGERASSSSLPTSSAVEQQQQQEGTGRDDSSSDNSSSASSSSLAVFRFPPLASSIAVVRVSG